MSRPLLLGTGPLKLQIWTLGARLAGASFEGVPLLAGVDSREEALGPKLYHGSVVGPVANRIAGGRVEIDGVRFDLPRNENGETTLHGGPDGLHARDWSVVDANDAQATLALELADGDCGLPGNRRFEARYEVGSDAFTLTLSATTDAPTYVNLALHPFWMLDAGGRDGLELAVRADRYTPVDARTLPTGDVAEVAGTIFDLRQIGEPSTEIDHNFVLSGGPEAPAVTLNGHRLTLEIFTDAPGLQVFTGKPFGIAIEPQHWPDAPHHPGFPSVRLDPGERWTQTSTYRFSHR